MRPFFRFVPYRAEASQADRPYGELIFNLDCRLTGREVAPRAGNEFINDSDDMDRDGVNV